MQDGHMAPSHDCLGVLVECVTSMWEGREEAASCASRFLACVAGDEQEEQLRRVLSFVEAVRGPLSERLTVKDASDVQENTMTEASRKRARCDAGSDDKEGRSEPQEASRAEVGGKGEARPGPSGQLGTAAVAAPAEEEASIHVHEGMSCGVKGVLLDGDLLGCVWGFVLGGSGRQDVCVLGQLSVVCRKWREVSLWDAWWVRIKEDVLPLLWEEEEGSGKAGSSRGRVMGHGRFLEGQRELVDDPESDEEWVQGLEAHVEVFDRMDGLPMLSMRGPVSFEGDGDGRWSMRMSSESPSFRGECAAFSAGSRDPQRRFANIEEYLDRGHGEEYPCCLCMRVTLRDMRTGRMALIWEERKGFVEVLDYVASGLLCSLEGRGQQQQQNLVGRLVDQGWIYFSVKRVWDQGEDVGEQDVLYSIDYASIQLVFTRVSGYSSDLTMEHLKWALKAALISGGSR